MIRPFFADFSAHFFSPFRAILCLLFSLFLSLNASAAERHIQCKVVGISDGDTLTCLLDRTPIKVRLLHIDAPESAQPFGNRAKQALAALTFKKTVTIQLAGYDRYQRQLGVVFDGQLNVNLALVEKGMAWAYRQTQPMYQHAQQQAQARKIGLWQDANPINPADWRANKRSDFSPNLPPHSSQYSPANLPPKNRQNAPLVTGIDCGKQLSCKEMERRGFSYAQVERLFRQCGWQARDGNHDGIPCNRLYRKAKRNE